MPELESDTIGPPFLIKLRVSVAGPVMGVVVFFKAPAGSPGLAGVPVLKVHCLFSKFVRPPIGLFTPLVVMLKVVEPARGAAKTKPKVKFPSPPTATVGLTVILVVAVTAGLEKVKGGPSLMVGKGT